MEQGKDMRATINRKFGRRQSDQDILHAAKNLVQCEKALNNQVDKILDSIGVTREQVEGKSEN